MKIFDSNNPCSFCAAVYQLISLIPPGRGTCSCSSLNANFSCLLYNCFHIVNQSVIIHLMKKMDNASKACQYRSYSSYNKALYISSYDKTLWQVNLIFFSGFLLLTLLLIQYNKAL